jgi:hypothetical protein
VILDRNQPFKANNMKRIFKWMTGSLLLCAALISFSVEKVQAQGGVSVSFQTFYDELSPYGQWIDDPEYGYVWSPEVEQDFRPYYSGGRWEMTDYGNTWVSDYDWGWAPFHYGRWAQSGRYGWIWVPGSEWGPAWVSWRTGGGCYGWAPMSPGISLSVAMGSYYAPNDWWTFIPQQYIYAPNYYNYWRGPRYNSYYFGRTAFIHNTYVYNNYTYVCGPRRHEVERAIGRRVNVYNIRNENRPGRSQVRNGAINMFRPAVNRTPRTTVREAPRNPIRAERSVVDRVPTGTRPNGRGNDEVRQNRADIRNDRQLNDRTDRRIAPRGERNDIQREPANNRMQREPRSNNMRMQRDPNLERNVDNGPRQDVNRMQEERINRQRAIEQQRDNEARENMQRREQQRPGRQQMDRQQGVERPQREWRRPEPQRQIERDQPRMERPQPQRVERAQPQPQRMERPQMQQQRVERAAPPQQRGQERRGR